MGADPITIKGCDNPNPFLLKEKPRGFLISLSHTKPTPTMTITNVAPIPAGQGRRRRRRPPLTGDTLPFFLLQRARPPSPLPQTTNIPAAGVAVASSKAGETRRDTPPSTPVTIGRIADENPTPRIVSLLVSSPTRSCDTPDPGALSSHAMPLRPRVCQLRPPRAGLPPRRRYRL